MTDIMKKFNAFYEVCTTYPAKVARLLREEPDDKVVGEFIGATCIFAVFGFTDLMNRVDKENNDENPEIAWLLEEMKPYRDRPEWKAMERDYVEMIDYFGGIMLDALEDTGT